MNEEIKITWKGNTNNISDLIVGKAKNIFLSNGLTTIEFIGKDIRSQKELTFYLTESEKLELPGIHSIKDLKDIELGDIIVAKNRSIRSIFRVNSNTNSVFATQRCNSNCLMCSQPPIDVDDTYNNYLVWDYAIDLIDIDITFINITGGEPTILGDYLVKLINKFLDKFKNLRIDVLTNGRLPAKDSYLEILKKIKEPHRVVFAVPLYSDLYYQHDYIVQAKDAFHQTCLGIHNLGDLGFLIEIRIVLHNLSVERLAPLSNFIHRNFPFVYHVTFMGLEIIGYTKANKDKLIIEDNNAFLKNLEEALTYLSKWKYNVSIYNTPLCHLPESLWKFARKSISEWKNSYHNDCKLCKMKPYCSGFFSWNLNNAKVKPIGEEKIIN